MTLAQILIRARSDRHRPLYFSSRGRDDGGTFLFSANAALRYLNKSGRDSRVSLSMADFTRADWQVVKPPGNQERQSDDQIR